jgi:hypothetical protein
MKKVKVLKVLMEIEKSKFNVQKKKSYSDDFENNSI